MMILRQMYKGTKQTEKKTQNKFEFKSFTLTNFEDHSFNV